MLMQTMPWKEVHPANDGARRSRQREAVNLYLMNVSFGNPQVYRRVQANLDFQAGMKALDPEQPGFIEEENLRNLIQTACLHLIDVTAALLKFAKENNMRISDGG